jgi:uncharacterized membrane protein YciS (DUF1049 family)
VLRRVALVVALLLLLAAATLFAALNRQVFEVDIALGRFAVSSGVALLITFSAGLLAGALWRSTWIARLLAERGRLRKALRVAEAARPAPAPRQDAG